MRVLCFGDSNTWGFTPISGKRYSSKIRWTKRLADNPEIEVIEEGLNSRTTVFSVEGEEALVGLQYIKPCFLSHRPLDYIVIMLGTNDTKIRYHASSEDITEGMRKLLHEIRKTSKEKGENPQILLISPAPMKILEDYEDFDEESAAKIKELESTYEKLAIEEDCQFLKASDVVKSPGEDGLHFTKENHEALAKAIEKKLVN